MTGKFKNIQNIPNISITSVWIVIKVLQPLFPGIPKLITIHKNSCRKISGKNQQSGFR